MAANVEGTTTAAERNESYFIDTATATAAIMAKLTHLTKVQANIQQLDQFEKDLTSNPGSISTLKERWFDLVGKVKNTTSSKISQILGKDSKTLTECDCRTIQEEVRKMKVKMANETVLVGAVVSAAIIMLQIWRLREVWMAVKDAKNVISDSKRKMELIKVKIEQLQAGATEMQELMTQYENESTSDQDKRRVMRKLRVKISRMGTMYIDARTMISELKVQIDGKTQVLAVYQREQITNAIMNGVHFVTNVIQCVQFWGMIGPGLQLLQGGITATFFGLAVGNTAMYVITEKTIKEIRGVLEQIDQMEIQLATISQTMHEAEDFVLLNEEN